MIVDFGNILEEMYDRGLKTYNSHDDEEEELLSYLYEKTLAVIKELREK